MMRLLLSTTVLLTLTASAASAQLTAQIVVSGLSGPVAFIQNPTLPNVQHIVEKAGRIRTLQSGVLQATPFLDIVTKVESAGEQGLLGLAFAPDYATSGRFFASYIRKQASTPGVGASVIARFRRSAADPLAADAASEFDLVWPDGSPYILHPYGNHKGGNIAFGPDGMLYFGLGDGGAGGDPGNRAQNPMTLLGKMLRLNVNVPDSDPQGYDVPANNPFVGAAGVLTEIWAFGLRNPWRWSFDDVMRGGTGALVMGDVGQGAWEEINYEPSGQGGRNYGWRLREGRHDYLPGTPPFSLPLREPIHDYAHLPGGSVTGGFVYRGNALGPAFFGRYFFADFVHGRVWSLGLAISGSGEASVADVVEHSADLGAAVVNVASFGVDSAGELYTVNYSGLIHRIMLATPAPPAPPPAAPPSGCATPDPFAAIGGGTCYGGGWLPPGMAPPSASPPLATPPPAAPPPAAGGGTCATPDPFAALGGGTCYGGGWLPPGMVPPSASPSTPPTAPPAPPTGGGTCATPDPFAALGGGTCYGGGWLPPGIPPPSTSPAPPAPPALPGPVGGCATPDPFVGIPGLVGVCINGGWIPTRIGG